MQKIRVRKRADIQENEPAESQTDKQKTKIADVRAWVTDAIRHRSDKTRTTLDKLFGTSERVSRPASSAT